MRRIFHHLGAVFLSAACLVVGIAEADALEIPATSEETPSFAQIGVASWYGPGFHRKRTASGARFDMFGVTAAHRSLPLHTIARVTNLDNGQVILVEINDRGPYVPGRVIDLSLGAARLLDMEEDGLAQVRVEVFDTDQTEDVARSDTPEHSLD